MTTTLNLEEVRKLIIFTNVAIGITPLMCKLVENRESGVSCHDFRPTPLEIVYSKITSNLVTDYSPASFFSISALSVFSHEKESSDLPK